MAQFEYITVTAPSGMTTPIHPNDGREPGGGLLYANSSTIVRVRRSQDIRRACGRGDLIPCDMNGAPVMLHLAGAPEELPGGRIAIERSPKKGPTT